MTAQIRREFSASFDEMVAQLPDALKTQGFGVLTEIDVKETLKKKIDVEFRRYTIFGTCNPPLAHQALQAELEIGLMLPCNVIVYEADGGGTVVSAVDPTQTIAGDHPKLKQLAETVRDKLARALDALH